jgi:hypothetical protein
MHFACRARVASVRCRNLSPALTYSWVSPLCDNRTRETVFCSSAIFLLESVTQRAPCQARRFPNRICIFTQVCIILFHGAERVSGRASGQVMAGHDIRRTHKRILHSGIFGAFITRVGNVLVTAREPFFFCR